MESTTREVYKRAEKQKKPTGTGADDIRSIVNSWVLKGLYKAQKVSKLNRHSCTIRFICGTVSNMVDTIPDSQQLTSSDGNCSTPSPHATDTHVQEDVVTRVDNNREDRSNEK